MSCTQKPNTGSQSQILSNIDEFCFFAGQFFVNFHICWRSNSKPQHAPWNTNLQIMVRPIVHPTMLKLVIDSATTLILNMWNVALASNCGTDYDMSCWRQSIEVGNINAGTGAVGAWTGITMWITIKMYQFWIQHWWSFWQCWQGGRKGWRLGGSNMDTRGIWGKVTFCTPTTFWLPESVLAAPIFAQTGSMEC